jgi:NAD(P)H dehydrogenase (quinone)
VTAKRCGARSTASKRSSSSRPASIPTASPCTAPRSTPRRLRAYSGSSTRRSCAAPDATFTFARDHFHTEEHIRAAGLGHTFLRDSIYLDYVPFFASADGVIRGPAGDGRAGAVARDDIADTAVAALLDGRHEGREYEVTGRGAITLAEAAAILTHVSGREVVYVEETLEEARASRAPSGAPDWEIEGWVTSYAAIADGSLDVVTDTVSRLAGHEPMTLPEFLEAHPESWAHLLPDAT